jgi:hypothetical protein
MAFGLKELEELFANFGGFHVVWAEEGSKLYKETIIA